MTDQPDRWSTVRGLLVIVLAQLVAMNFAVVVILGRLIARLHG